MSDPQECDNNAEGILLILWGSLRIRARANKFVIGNNNQEEADCSLRNDYRPIIIVEHHFCVFPMD